MNSMFNGKNVVVTGASSGIGKQVALDFSKEGANVVLIARRKDRLKEVKDECGEFGGKVIAVSCDVSDYMQIESAVHMIKKEFPKIDILINNAGVGRAGSLEKMDVKDVEDMIKVNYLGIVYCTKEFLPQLIESRGHIVNIGSIAGRFPTINFAGYCASKYAVAGFSECMQLELKAKGIKVHLINPGIVKTEIFNHPSLEHVKNSKTRFMEPSEISKAIMDSIRKNQFEVFVPWKWKMVYKIKILSYSLFNWIRKILRR